MKNIELHRFIDHTLLKPEAKENDIIRLCDEAKKYDFWSVCVNTHYVPLVKSQVKGTGIKVCSVSGFPLGAVNSLVKAFEAERAVSDGADEIDMVLNIGALKSGREKYARDDIKKVVKACAGEAIVKVIIEAALLSEEEKREACLIAVDGGASFVKTSTGFGPPGANVHDVEIMRETVGDNFGVKASAGIRTAKKALELIEAGADRIGASAGVKIIEEFRTGDF
ncbi:MAG TPA: deoxyribose-phosphate aldolase [Candidatus Krumholzibacteriaceae bacterium]|nr:deoxyribose-phosphate aldolase [Candidatus Krumholzibacteriaceae bacterium]